MKAHMSDASQPRAFRNHPDLSAPVEQERLSPAAIGAFVNIAKIWSLNDVQALGLLGVLTVSTFLEWKTGMEGRTLDEDTLMRISFLIGIFESHPIKILQMRCCYARFTFFLSESCAIKPELGGDFHKTENETFGSNGAVTNAAYR
jgi:hypothetical protein